jgi:hypothetical protein
MAKEVIRTLTIGGSKVRAQAHGSQVGSVKALLFKAVSLLEAINSRALTLPSNGQ